MFAVARIGKFVSRNFPILYDRFFIESIVRFGLLICGCKTSSKLRSLYIVLRRLLKLIFFGKQRESVSCLFSESTILIVYNLYILDLLKFVLKSVMAKLPTRYLNSFYQLDVKYGLFTRSVSFGLFKEPRLN